MCIHINLKERCLVDSSNGDIFYPSCFNDLVLYHGYLMSTHRKHDACKLLKSVVKGEKVISNMVEEVKRIKEYK